MSDDLSNCPFCGGEPYFARLSGTHGGIKCRSCEAATGLQDSKVRAIAIWNRRAPDPALTAALAEVQRLRDENANLRGLLPGALTAARNIGFFPDVARQLSAALTQQSQAGGGAKSCSDLNEDTPEDQRRDDEESWFFDMDGKP